MVFVMPMLLISLHMVSLSLSSQEFLAIYVQPIGTAISTDRQTDGHYSPFL